MDIVRVALDVPIPHLFDYRLDSPSVAPLLGRRVLVPFGRGRKIGVIVEVGKEAQIAAQRIKPVTRLFNDEPVLALDVLTLMQFAADYYHHPLGQVVISALPRSLRQITVSDSERPAALALSEAGRAALGAGGLRSNIKRQLLEALLNQEAMLARTLRTIAPSAGTALRELLLAGWIVWTEAQREQSAVPQEQKAATEFTAGPELTADQKNAVAALVAGLSRYAVWLLLGVTGSGKTEVYFQLIASVLRQGQQCLLLVPEINLTPQLDQRFRQRFPGVVLISLHSDLSEAQRLRCWREAEAGRAQVVVGTRLAVFTPMPRLGLIVVDEEHDASLKQQEGLRYSARDLAVLRAKERGIPVILGSATPSLESYAHALAGRYHLLQLRSRPGTPLPDIRTVDTRGVQLHDGLSPELIAALGERLQRREQSLIFINRRGYAPALMCFACGWAAGCSRCTAKLVLHLQQAKLRCHYCGHEEVPSSACAACGNQDIAPAGHGTQRLESAVQRLFPQARVLRVDRDSARHKQAFVAMQTRIHAHEVDVLVGTQMLAKGHDFPRLTLVGVVNADSALYSSDFRAAERLFAQLIQVAGRAGRAEVPGQVLIQTMFPTHPLYRAVCRQDYASHADHLLTERQQAGFPPSTHLAVLRAEAGKRAAVQHFLETAIREAGSLSAPVTIYDPVPASIARIAGRERGHVLVQCSSRRQLQQFLEAWQAMLSQVKASQVRWSIDVDPLDV